MSDLDVLDPAPIEATYRGERLAIKPLTIGQLPAFTRFVRPIVDEFNRGHEAWNTDDDSMVMDMLALHGEGIVQALAIATGKPADWIAAGTDPGELLALCMAAVQANRDFFIRSVRASLHALAIQQASAVVPPSATNGSPASRGSLPVATH